MNHTTKPYKTARVLLLSLAALVLVLAALFGIYDATIPDRVSYFEGDELPVYLAASPTVLQDEGCPCSAGQEQSHALTVQYRLFDLIPVKTATAEAYRRLQVYPGGMPFGVKFFTSGVTIVGFSDVEAGGKTVNPAREAGLKQKDIITHVDGRELADAADLTEAIEASGGRPLTLSCLRGERSFEVTVTPTLSGDEGRYKTGILVRDSGAGIGTVSFILPESNYFAGLGHGICDTDTGALVPICRGTVVDVTISGITKGESGSPGEIHGFFNPGKTGTLLGNTDCGVYGVLSHLPKECKTLIPIALKDDLAEGDAYILSTLDDGGIGRYDVRISDINRNAEGGKCFTVTVTDPDLLEKTGGIVQGMSGSPIIQNGKLVGAVTHVLVSDPTRGYGIFIENMLNAAEIPQARES